MMFLTVELRTFKSKTKHPMLTAINSEYPFVFPTELACSPTTYNPCHDLSSIRPQSSFSWYKCAYFRQSYKVLIWWYSNVSITVWRGESIPLQKEFICSFIASSQMSLQPSRNTQPHVSCWNFSNNLHQTSVWSVFPWLWSSWIIGAKFIFWKFRLFLKSINLWFFQMTFIFTMSSLKLYSF